MLMIALTGGVGSGKSTAAATFKKLGAQVLEADRLAKEALAAGTSGLAEVEKRFGQQVIKSDGSLDRQALATIVFNDSVERTALEAIVHPRVQRAFAECTAKLAADAVVIYEVPLLAEINRADDFQLVIAIETPLSVRVERLARRGLSQVQAMERIAAQASNDQRRAVADIVLANAGEESELAAAVTATWELRLAKFARNLAAGEPAAPEWMPGELLPNLLQLESQIARIANRVAWAIEGRVSVCSMTELRFASDAANLSAKLRHLGFVEIQPGHRYTSADPGRPLRLVVDHQ